jgi:outer membrane protein
MQVRLERSTLLLVLCIYTLIPQTGLKAQTKINQDAAATNEIVAPKWFPTIFRPYQEQVVPHVVLENSPRLESLLRDGKLELTLADALALALENNLDIAVQRYIPKFAQTDVLRTQSGQAARGFEGASIPGGLSAGALGAGVSTSGTGTGVGSAGGITGGGGAVSVGSTGNFDPSFSFNLSWDRVISPLNTQVVAGVPVVTGTTTAFSSSYAQLFHTGTSYSLSLSGQRQTSTQKNLLFNPADVARFALGANQPLLNGFGRLPNERFIRVARNNTKVSEQVFQQQIITTAVLVENTCWDLAAFQQNVRVAEQSLAVSERLLRDNQARVEIGTMSPLEVVSAEAEVAARTRDLTIASTNLQLQEATLKNMLVKKVSPELDAARIVIKDTMPEPRASDIPELQPALASAFEKRPDLKQAESSLFNQDIAAQFTTNSLLPGAAVFGFYAGSGLGGQGTQTETGLLNALGQSFKGDYPEYAGGLTLTIPLKNRVAQADNLRSQLEGQQLRISLQRSRNQVSLEVRKAIIGMIQGKAQVEAAHEAVRLAREMWQGEQNKLEAGASTSYQVILRERDFIAAQQAEVVAMAGYAKAMVELDRATGSTMGRNGIEFADALSGKVTKMPVTPFSSREPAREVK